MSTAEVLAQSRHHLDYIEAPELTADVFTPTQVWFIDGAPGQDKPTWGLIETQNGKKTLSAGYISEFERGDTLSLYCIGDTMFVLPTEHYFMHKGILRKRNGKKLEELTVEFDPCLCEQTGDGIAFNRDSVSKNTMQPYKMIAKVGMEDVDWRREGSYFLPGIPVTRIDSLDSFGKSAYGLIPVTEGGVGCDILWTRQEERNSDTKTQVYAPSFREGKRFAGDGDDYLFEGRKTEYFIVVRDAPKKGKGAKRIKHKKQERKF